MRDREDQPALPDMELVNLVESMPFGERVKEKRRLMQEIADRESLIGLIDDANHAEGQSDEDLVVFA